jgi:hypothetical protein
MLAAKLDLSRFDPEIAKWLRRALSPTPPDRFMDAFAMQEAWRDAVRGVLERDEDMPWWRRFLPGEHERAETLE